MGATYSKREVRGWYAYDWANSAFYTTVVTLFLGPYLTSLARAGADANGMVHPLGIPVSAVSLWPYLVSLAVVLQVGILPVTGAIADYGHRKREMLGALALIGSIATVAMFWLTDGRYMLGAVLFLIANSAFGASIVVYNSFLPEIAPPEERDNVSSRGWGIGYIGGGLLLVLNLLLYANADLLGIGQSLAVRISLASAGLWWAGFTLIPMATLVNRKPHKQPAAGKHYIAAALHQLVDTVKEIRGLPMTLRFLCAYLLYNDAIQTVITLAAQFGQEELKLPVSALTTGILIAQFVGVVGALGFNQIAQRIGNKNAVLTTLATYCGVLGYGYAFVSTETEFYVMAGLIGAVMGGSQALSRSMYSLMIPKGHEAEYFAIYEISDRGTSWIGPLFFGLALQFTGNYRISILSLIVFFIAGFVLLRGVDLQRAQAEAAR